MRSEEEVQNEILICKYNINENIKDFDGYKISIDKLKYMNDMLKGEISVLKWVLGEEIY